LAHSAERLDHATIDDLAETIAHFHNQAETSGDPDFGSTERVAAPMRQNFSQLRQRGFDSETLTGLNDWTERALKRLSPLLEARLTQGRIRECHGDLHLGNIAMIDARPVIFDAIEFNPALHWIDPINDIAFLTMDLRKRDRADLIGSLLDRYLQITGDYPGLPLLQFYEVYRALVRAKVDAIRFDQDNADHEPIRREAEAYIALAQCLTLPGQAAIVITHGPSGSGKSTATEALPRLLPAIRVRSDVERKRLLALSPQDNAAQRGGYSREVTQRTYQRLAQCAAAIVASGRIALLDATFLQAGRRQRFRDLASELGVPFLILDFEAPREVLEQRVTKRMSQTPNVSDADLQVLHRQLATRDPLTAEERRLSLTCRPDRPLEVGRLRSRLGIGGATKTAASEPQRQVSDLSPST
jgi:predicted kinase